MFSRDVIWEKLGFKKTGTAQAKETAVVCPLPPKKPDTSDISLPESLKSVKSSSPSISTTTTSIPDYTLTPQASSTPTKDLLLPLATSTPINRSVESPKPLEPPAKPPRSPSPHPIKSDTLDDIEYEDEEEEEEEGSDAEEDDENSVIASSPRRSQLSNTVNEMINQEKGQSGSLRLNQTR